jgi:cyanamide hydratase
MVTTEPLPGKYGWIAVPRDLDNFTANTSTRNTSPAQASSIQIPVTNLARAVFESATKLLPKPTVNHCLRVFLYGSIIMQQHFPELLTSWPDFPETFYITCILHDVGTAPTLLTTTKMSFEFRGGIYVWDLLKELKAEEDLVEGVTEAIIRHQDLGTTGEISALGAIIQVATVFGALYQCSSPSVCDCFGRKSGVS